METRNELFEVEFKKRQLDQMKIELLVFLRKAQSNGFLETVEFRDIPSDNT
ncbi:hypothetical protein [Sporosarcina sp. YIM B06819]|uniref:hypothetical protein n=1 Tax=Sporosarcina sp. YIM B06819 TaxID=3081769 RepID=UPI00298CD49A|nr:hypothetical protein [Sporosarcina sp. YIM B06819]